MKLVRFNRQMSPYVVGEERAVPDDVADRLVASGDASVVPSVFDGQPSAARPSRQGRVPRHRSV